MSWAEQVRFHTITVRAPEPTVTEAEMNHARAEFQRAVEAELDSVLLRPAPEGRPRWSNAAWIIASHALGLRQDTVLWLNVDAQPGQVLLLDTHVGRSLLAEDNLFALPPVFPVKRYLIVAHPDTWGEMTGKINPARTEAPP